MIRRPPRSTLDRSSAASDVYKRQELVQQTVEREVVDLSGIERRRFTISEYELLIKIGLLAEDERVELIEGELVEMSPINLSHVLVVNRLTYLLTQRLAQRAILSVQNPVRLGPRSMPQPDVALWRYWADEVHREKVGGGGRMCGR